MEGEGKMALLVGRSVLEREVGDRVDECIVEEAEPEKELVYNGSPHEPGPL